MKKQCEALVEQQLILMQDLYDARGLLVNTEYMGLDVRRFNERMDDFARDALKLGKSYDHEVRNIKNALPAAENNREIVFISSKRADEVEASRNRLESLTHDFGHDMAKNIVSCECNKDTFSEIFREGARAARYQAPL